MGGAKGAFTKVIGMAKEQGMFKEVKKEEPKQEETLVTVADIEEEVSVQLGLSDEGDFPLSHKL